MNSKNLQNLIFWLALDSPLFGWSDWCWHFNCHSPTAHYLCSLWFSDGGSGRTPHMAASARSASSGVYGCTYSGDLAEIYRILLFFSFGACQCYSCGPDAVGGLGCPSHATLWKCVRVHTRGLDLLVIGDLKLGLFFWDYAGIFYCFFLILHV